MVCFHGGGWATCWGSGKGTAAWAASHGFVGIEVEYAATHGALQLAHDGEPEPVAGTESVLGPLEEGDAPYPQCLRDAGRAMRLVRSLAAKGELPVDAQRVCACGFSAGGWLVGMMCTVDADYLASSSDDDLSLEGLSCVPDRAAICYGVSSIEAGTLAAAEHAVRRLLGEHLFTLASLRANLSPARHFGEGTPPLFLWHTVHDELVPSAHALDAYTAARAAGVANVELHLYGSEGAQGRHAQGLARDNPSLCGWSDQLLAWLGDDFRAAAAGA